MSRRVLFTGGGSAGHVTPNLALIEVLIEQGDEVAYVGSHAGIERELVSLQRIPYYSIASGKLRRYFSWQNFVDPALILWGTLQALAICLRWRPAVIFSKGGFVAVPVVVAGWLLRIPVISHESDMTPGLANRLCAPFSRYLCVTFEAAGKHFPAHKIRHTGSPVRAALRQGNGERGRSWLGFEDTKPILLVFGGSLGAEAINQVIWRALPELLEHYSVVHVTGRGNEQSDLNQPGYKQIPFLDAEFGDVLAAAELAVSRAGSNSLYELLLTRTRHLLVPLTREASRGDQLVNAAMFEQLGTSLVVQEEAFTPETLLAGLLELQNNEQYARALAAYVVKDGVAEIVLLLDEVCPRAKT